MPSLYQNIRGVLQTRALATPGFPVSVAFEGKTQSPPAPTAGVTYARLTLMPTRGRPFDVGNGTKRHSGIFLVDVFFASDGDPGTGDVEALADAVKAAMPPGAKLVLNGETVKIDASERSEVLPADGWLHCPVTVTWHCFSRNN